MIIDFHSHSNASDGALSPQELVAEALRAGVSQFAITDHDTIAGLQQLLRQEQGLPEHFRLRTGVELSCRWANSTVHVVGLDFDVEHPAMVAGLQQLQQARLRRAATIARRLERLGYPGALEGARLEAGQSQIGRPHFAAWMIDQGYVSNANQAFAKYLGAGKPGDVKAFWPELADVCQWIVEAGGTAVLAHPLKYKYTRMKLRRLITDFVGAGGAGLEVRSGRQTPDQVRHLCQLAREFELLLSAGSDFHQHWKYGAAVGVDVAGLSSQPNLWARP